MNLRFNGYSGPTGPGDNIEVVRPSKQVLRQAWYLRRGFPIERRGDMISSGICTAEEWDAYAGSTGNPSDEPVNPQRKINMEDE